MDVRHNGMIYTFTKEEVSAVAKLIRWAREYKKNKAKDTIKTVASAFNRPFFEGSFIEEVLSEEDRIKLESGSLNR